MKGLELSQRYFETFGIPMLASFGEAGTLVSAGLAGYGSECYGYDDELSTDHDFGPRFYLWIDDQTDRKIGFELMRAYRRLPTEFMGYRNDRHSLFGENRGGVVTVKDFFRQFTGLERIPERPVEWLFIPEYALSAAVNGIVFREGCKEFDDYRNRLIAGMPDATRRKKIAARLAVMAQSGQYNLKRCLIRNDRGAAGLAAAEFVNKGLELLFLLNRRYAPYYKWIFRAAKELPVLADLVAMFESVLTETPGDRTVETVETICQRIVSELQRQGYTRLTETYLEPHAVEIYTSIRDPELIGLHLMEG